MKTQYKFLLVCLGLFLLFIVGLVFEKLVLETATKSTQQPGVTTPKDNPPVQYNSEKTKQMREIFQNRPTLSATDQAARKKLAAQQNPIHGTSNFSVEYLSSPDEFMVEILTTDIETAKAETVAWFENQGISQEGICHLPLVFFLNYDVAQKLRGTNTEFNPLPSGC